MWKKNGRTYQANNTGKSISGEELMNTKALDKLYILLINKCQNSLLKSKNEWK